MITLRRAEDRGATKLHWLDSRHTFSFGNYYDPKQIGYSSLRVVNEDRVVPGAGFPTHSHRDMEIVTYVLCRPRLIMIHRTDRHHGASD